MKVCFLSSVKLSGLIKDTMNGMKSEGKYSTIQSLTHKAVKLFLCSLDFFFPSYEN